MLHTKSRRELNKRRELQILYIPLREGTVCILSHVAMRKIQGGCQPLTPGTTERGLKIQSSTFLWALTNPRTFSLDLQRAICSADDLLEVFRTAVSNPAQRRAGAWGKTCQWRRQDCRSDSNIPSPDSCVTVPRVERECGSDPMNSLSTSQCGPVTSMTRAIEETAYRR